MMLKNLRGFILTAFNTPRAIERKIDADTGLRRLFREAATLRCVECAKICGNGLSPDERDVLLAVNPSSYRPRSTDSPGLMLSKILHGGVLADVRADLNEHSHRASEPMIRESLERQVAQYQIPADPSPG